MKTYCHQLVFVIVLLLSSFGVFSAHANEQQHNSAQLVVIEDSYVDSSSPDGNFNAQALAFEYSSIFDTISSAYCPAVTKISYLKFDLSNIDFAISKARLSLGQGDCSIDEPLPIQLFAADNDWQETNLTWNTQPRAVYGFTEIPTNQNAIYQWNDETIGDDGLADWLAYQKEQGATTVTLGMVMITMMGCGDQTIKPIGVLFNDRERTTSAQRSSCANFDIIPTLQIADSNTPLVSPELAPTAVTMTTNSAESTSSFSFLIVFSLLAVATWIGRKVQA